MFSFTETRPYSENFEAFGTGDMSLFFNSGSCLFIIFMTVVYVIVMKVLYLSTRGAARLNPFARKVSMWFDT